MKITQHQILLAPPVNLTHCAGSQTIMSDNERTCQQLDAIGGDDKTSKASAVGT